MIPPLRALLLLPFLGAAACASGPSEPASGHDAAQPEARAPVSHRGPPALKSTLLARVPSVTYGPYLGVGSKGGLVVWAALEGAKRTFSGVPLSALGRPLSAARTIAPAPDQLGLVAVRPTASGFVLVHTHSGAEGEILQALCIGPAGEALAPSVALASISGRALWVEAVPTAGRTLVFYGSRPESGKRIAEIGLVTLDAACQPGERSTIAREALAWQAIRFGQGALLSIVRAAEGSLGNVEALTIDAQGKLQGTSVVSGERAADLDLDAAPFGDNAVLAWTERRGIEPRLMGALLDATGKLVAPPRALTPPEGEQALIRLMPSANAERVYLAWENLSERPAHGRVVQLSALASSLQLSGPRARLEYHSDDGGVPEFSATAEGLSALTLAPVCLKGARCDEADIAPVYVALDHDFTPLAAEPLRLDALNGAAVELGFGLGCTEQGCLAIAAMARTPAPIFATELQARSSSFRAPVSLVDQTQTPRVIAHEALSRGPALADFAVQIVQDQVFLATLSDFDPTTPWRKLDKPTPDGRRDPLRARLTLERLMSGPKPIDGVSASPISLRAHSVGGVVIAPGNPGRGELLVAWAGVDQGVPQVFLTLVGKTGNRLVQRMLTRQKGDLGQIAAAWVDDGWVVAWVDERFDDPEIFAAKIDARLNRVGPEHRITEAPGAAADLALAYQGGTLCLVWSDARAADAPGRADIYSILLGARDAAPKQAETRVAATRAHSFSPSVQPRGGGFAVAWAERGEGSEPGSIARVRIDADGRAGPVVPLSLTGAEPRSVSISCTDTNCRIAAIVEQAHVSTLSVLSGSGDERTAQLVPVLSLLGSGGAIIPPLIQGDSVFFVDASGSEARVRRAKLAW